MKIQAALLASLLMIVAAPASADVTWTTDVTVSSGNPLNDLVVGDVVTIDVTLRSDGDPAALGLGGGASAYDSSIINFTSAQAAGNFLTAACVPTLGCLGGFSNLQVGAGFSEDNSNPVGPIVQFALGADPAGFINTGEIDEGFDGIGGSPQFQVVFTAAQAGTTSIVVGADPDFFNNLITPGGLFGVSNNDTVTVTVPEPGAAISSLAALGSVFAIVGLRRRR